VTAILAAAGEDETESQEDEEDVARHASPRPAGWMPGRLAALAAASIPVAASLPARVALGHLGR
jgi:hypothetical protein